MPLIDLNGLGYFKDRENAMVAPDYSASATYAVGDYVFYNGVLYKCKTAITTAEAFTAGHWEADVLANDVAELNNSITQLDDAVYTYTQSIDPAIKGGTNTAVTSNGDGTYTVGTTDYGNNWFGSAPTALKAGKYILYGTEKGYSWVNTTASHNNAIATNNTGEPKEITLEAGSYYIGFRMNSAPSTSFVIAPSLLKINVKADLNTADIETIKKEYYVLTPTGDNTSRTNEVATILTTNKAIYFTSGEYYFATKLTLPSGSRLMGAGKSSVLIFSNNSTGQMIDCGNDCQISNLKFDGGLSSKPEDATTNRHCIRVQTNTQTLQMDNCWVVGFGGSGVRVDNTGYAQLSSVQIANCYFQYNGYGINYLEHGEYGVVSNCSFIDNYYGAFVQGGNNIFSGCAFERNRNGALVDGSGVSNNGHGAFVGCSFNHNTHIGLEINNTSNGYLVSGCQFFQNTSYELTTNATGVNVCGCNFGVSTHMRFSTSAFASFDGCVFGGSPVLEYTGTSKTKSADNYTFDGRQVFVLHPSDRVFAPVPQGAMLTIIDDDGHSKFYTDLLPLIQSKKVPISTAIYNTSVGVAANTMTWAQVQECYEAGAEILSHSYDHTDTEGMTSLTENDIQNRDQKSKNELLSKGYYGGNYLVYAGTTGSIEKVKNAAKNVFACAITSTGDTMNYIDTLDPYYLRRYRIEAETSYDVDAMKALIDSCISSGGWMIWMIHTSSANWSATTLAALGDAIDYALAQGLPIVTVDAGCRKMGII